MLDKDVWFIILIGVALGLGKVVPRLQVRTALIFAGAAFALGSVAIAAYARAFETSPVSMLLWVGACLMIGIISSHLTLAGDS